MARMYKTPNVAEGTDTIDELYKQSVPRKHRTK